MEKLKTNTTFISKTEERLMNARNEVISQQSDVSYRLEWVRTLNEVEFVNDSKSANFIMSAESLDQLDKQIVWIVSCDDFLKNFNYVDSLVQEKVRAIIYLGDRLNDDILNMLSDKIEIYFDAETIEAAVTKATSIAKPAEAVLFSPATPGYKSLGNYKVMGDQFNNAVASL